MQSTTAIPFASIKAMKLIFLNHAMRKLGSSLERTKKFICGWRNKRRKNADNVTSCCWFFTKMSIDFINWQKMMQMIGSKRSYATALKTQHKTIGY